MQKTSAQEALYSFIEKTSFSRAGAKGVLQRFLGKNKLTPEFLEGLASHHPRVVSRAAGLPAPFAKANVYGGSKPTIYGYTPRNPGYTDFGGPELTASLRDRKPGATQHLMKLVGP